jgi:hypothetical protein
VLLFFLKTEKSQIYLFNWSNSFIQCK